jgi:hypothetical protein
MKYLQSVPFQLLLKLLLVFPLLSQCSQDDNSDNPPKEPSIKITSISPESGAIGTVVEISGKGFSETMEDNIVKFNGVQAEVFYATKETLIVTVPSSTTTGKVTVTVGSETATGPVFTITDKKTYYIKFKINGVQKLYEQNSPNIWRCSQCACGVIVPDPGIPESADIQICNDEGDMVTAEDIESWQGETIFFTNSFPKGGFSFGEIKTKTDLYTQFASSQEGSEMNITNVTKVTTGFKWSSYRVTGNFKCKAAATYAGPDIDITDGEFVLLFTEQ